MKYPQLWQMRWGGGVSLWSCCGVACLQHLFPPPTPSSWTIHLLINQDHADDDGDGGGDCGHRVVTLKTKLIVTTNTSLCVAAYNDRAGHERILERDFCLSSHKICCIQVTVGISPCLCDNSTFDDMNTPNLVPWRNYQARIMPMQWQTIHTMTHT